MFSTLRWLLILAHPFVAWRLTRGFAMSRRATVVVWVLALLGMATIPAARWVRDHDLDLVWVQALTWAGYLEAGMMSMLLVLVLARDLAALVGRLGGAVAGRLAGSDPVAAAAAATRRQWLMKSSNLAIVGATSGLTGLGVWEARRLAEVRPVRVPIDGLPADLDGMRIVQISDLHVGRTVRGDYVERIVGAIMDRAPDMIVITGDLIDGPFPPLREDVASLARLRAPHGVWFVTGNHEYSNDVEAWLAHLETLGLRMLHNAHALVERGAGRLLVAGVTDIARGHRLPGHAHDPAAALAGAPAADARLLLAHQPRTAPAVAGMGFDLMLCGHTHGGQFFPWNFAIDFAHPFVRGLNRQDDGMWVYVSRGTGYWGPPLRAGVPAEITEITLSRA